MPRYVILRQLAVSAEIVEVPDEDAAALPERGTLDVAHPLQDTLWERAAPVTDGLYTTRVDVVPPEYTELAAGSLAHVRDPAVLWFDDEVAYALTRDLEILREEDATQRAKLATLRAVNGEAPRPPGCDTEVAKILLGEAP